MGHKQVSEKKQKNKEKDGNPNGDEVT